MHTFLLRFSMIVILLAAWAEPARAEGLRIVRVPASSSAHSGDCRPGRDPSDPHCCVDRFAQCRIACKQASADNGDMLFEKRCLRACEDDLRRCRGGR